MPRLVSGNWRIFLKQRNGASDPPRPKATPKPMLLEASGSPWDPLRFLSGTSLERVSRGFEVEIGPYRHMVRRLFPAAHIAIDPDIDQPIAGLRRQQQMIDAQTVVFLPRARLIIPECVLSRCVGNRAQRVGEPEAKQRLKTFAGGRAKQRVID